MHKTHVKSFVFEILIIIIIKIEIIAEPFISLMATFEVYNVFSF